MQEDVENFMLIWKTSYESEREKKNEQEMLNDDDGAPVYMRGEGEKKIWYQRNFLLTSFFFGVYINF